MDEKTIKWAEVTINMEEPSFDISEEENESGSDYGSEVKSIPIQQIWDSEALWEELLLLPDGDELKDPISTENSEEILKKNHESGFLMAAWLGKSNVLSVLLDAGVSINTQDKYERTALHLSSYAGHTECVSLLLSRGAEVNAIAHDQNVLVTPLHCAASMGHLNCLRLLIKHGAHVNVGIEKRSPLHYAVQNLAVECVRELLEHNAIPNTPQVYSEAPLHVAAALGNEEAVKLLLQYGAAVKVQSGTDKLTPLHLAAEQGYPSCVRLLIEAGANVNAINRKKQTALHLAVMSQCTETVELLLQKGANSNAQDCDGRTPLHCSTVNVQRTCECARTLLKYGANPNTPDAYGYTPIHTAALNEFSNCVLLLIQSGGDVTLKTKGGISAMNFITKKTPEVLPKYIASFDNSIHLNAHDIGDMDCQLKLDFRILVPNVGHQETSLLTTFIEVGQKQILEHPLCETFLLLKWRVIRNFFFFSLLYQAIFVALFSAYIKGIYLKDCPSFRSVRRKDSCYAEDIYIDMGYYLLSLNILLMFKELFQILHSCRTYVCDWENYLQWTIIVSVFLCVQPTYQMNIREFLYTWQHHVAAVSVFLAWVELMMIVARFPAFGLYVQMFATVSFNFAKFMCAYFCLIVAFTLCFGVIFANYPAFRDLKWVFLKVIIMMSGELEYEDVFFSDTYEIKYPYTAHIAYLVFVILVTIVLSNLMVGLAVNDIQGLQKSASLDRLVRQVKLMAHLESMLFSKLLKWVPQRVMTCLHQRALLLRSQRDYTLDVRPNDPRENKIPKHLIENAFRVAVSKKEKAKGRSFRRVLSPKSSSEYKSGVEKFLQQNEEEFMAEVNKMIRHRFERIQDELKAYKQVESNSRS
ncbi:transient receptor potential channel pyrexia [Anthonomus grandis grandis]|uniref:transient receptor potential channel pyrexia n=1 Tax=Anthonomus grandis grandis TaxID=2921223 RepID=UPI0021653282|nr:transient receptor potential channel pyrexia [Anthonomus grandis grandis]XP_050296440.1 transient receptor potential channel pyrexia [Anthonomus grandis grandis]